MTKTLKTVIVCLVAAVLAVFGYTLLPTSTDEPVVDPVTTDAPDEAVVDPIVEESEEIPEEPKPE